MEQYIQPHEADGPRLLLHTFSSYLFLCLPPLRADIHARPVNEHYHKQGIPLKSSHTDAGKVIYYKIRLITHMEFTTARSKTISVLRDWDFIIAASARSLRIWFLTCLFVNVCTLKHTSVSAKVYERVSAPTIHPELGMAIHSLPFFNVF